MQLTFSSFYFYDFYNIRNQYCLCTNLKEYKGFCRRQVGIGRHFQELCGSDEEAAPAQNLLLVWSHQLQPPEVTQAQLVLFALLSTGVTTKHEVNLKLMTIIGSDAVLSIIDSLRCPHLQRDFENETLS